jgi:hypothetical protein
LLNPRAEETDMLQTERAITSADLLTLGEEATTKWLVEQRLPLTGASVLAGTEGIGKRTMACELALCVARGKPWLGFPVNRGPVLYAKLHEFSKLRGLFLQGGLEPSDEIYFIDAEEPVGRLERIREYAKALEPALIVIDGLRQLQQGDACYRRANDGGMIDRVFGLGSDCDAQVLLIHDIVDSLAGDLAEFISGTSRTLDSILMLSSKDGERVLRTAQREGLDLLDGIPLPVRDTALEAAKGELETQIFAYLRRCGSLVERDEITRNVSWPDAAEVRAVVKVLHRRGELIRTGRGTHADPYRYTGFDRFNDPTRPIWLRRVRPWARIGRGSPAQRHV